MCHRPVQVKKSCTTQLCVAGDYHGARARGRGLGQASCRAERTAEESGAERGARLQSGRGRPFRNGLSAPPPRLSPSRLLQSPAPVSRSSLPLQSPAPVGAASAPPRAWPTRHRQRRPGTARARPRRAASPPLGPRSRRARSGSSCFRFPGRAPRGSGPVRPASRAHAGQAARGSGEAPLTLTMSSRHTDPSLGPQSANRRKRADGLPDKEVRFKPAFQQLAIVRCRVMSA